MIQEFYIRSYRNESIIFKIICIYVYNEIPLILYDYWAPQPILIFCKL